MIYNYGLFWRRDLIYWGKGGKGDYSGHLWGMTSRSKRGIPRLEAEAVDFRTQIGVYALYYDFELVYIGQAGGITEKGGEGKDFHTRLGEHRGDHLADRWTRFSWFGTLKVGKSGVLGNIPKGVNLQRADFLNILEAVAISISEPKLNRQGGSWGPAKEYFQWWSEKEIKGQE